MSFVSASMPGPDLAQPGNAVDNMAFTHTFLVFTSNEHADRCLAAG